MKRPHPHQPDPGRRRPRPPRSQALRPVFLTIAEQRSMWLQCQELMARLKKLGITAEAWKVRAVMRTVWLRAKALALRLGADELVRGRITPDDPQVRRQFQDPLNPSKE